MRRLLLLIILVALGWFAWSHRDRLRQRFHKPGVAEESDSVELRPSAQLAEIAGAKLDNLKNGRAESATFHSTELQSLLQYRFIQLLPAFVDDPEVELRDGEVEVKARVPADRLPSINGLGDAAAFLPDTTDVSMTGKLLPLDNGRVALSIQDVKAARIPLPARLIPGALQRMGRRDEAGLPRNALALPLPPGISSAYIDSDSLVLLARPKKRSAN
jgi:hypothetical protein